MDFLKDQSPEILVGVKSGLTSFSTQKLEFKEDNSYPRPGALLTLQIDGKNYSDHALLYLEV